MTGGEVPPVSIAWQPEAPLDLHRFIDPGWHGEVARLLVALKQRPMMGDWLETDDRTGDLSDCRKISFGPDRGRGPTYRLVYRLLPDNYRPAVVEVVAIGPRDELLAYALAATRLGRRPD